VHKLEAAGDVARLVRALDYADRVTDRDGRSADLAAPIRAEVAAALGRLDGATALEGLLRALFDPEELVRVAAVGGLRERGGPEALGALLSVAATWTQPSHAAARAEAVGTLVAMADPDVPARVAELLLARPGDLDEADADAFARLARAAGGDALAATADGLVSHLREAPAPARARMLLVALRPHSVDALIECLGDEHARLQAAVALGEARDARAVEPLCGAVLGDGDPAVRSAAAWALGEIRDPAAVETLLRATRDGEYRVRISASDAFDKLGNAAVAVAVAALARPALEAGARGGGVPAAALHDGAAAPVEPRPAQPLPPSRRAPMLRRLFGR
jgi:HEAT repeat protein